MTTSPDGKSSQVSATPLLGRASGKTRDSLSGSPSRLGIRVRESGRRLLGRCGRSGPEHSAVGIDS
jgi:hypothetical protein